MMNQSLIDIFVMVCGSLITGSIIYMANSISNLNIRIAVMIEKMEGHEKRIRHLEEEA